MRTILIIIRSEGDFERAISIGLAAKNKFKLSFIFVGDFSPFYKDGIQNVFQKKLFLKSGFEIMEFSDFSFFGRKLKKLTGKKELTSKNARKNLNSLISYIFLITFKKYLSIREDAILAKIYSKIKPSFLFTDQSMTKKSYLPEKFRQKAKDFKIPVYIFTHGAAGGLHSEFSDPVYEKYNGYTVLACNKNETDPSFENRIILGDMSSSFPYVHYLNDQTFDEIEFGKDSKYRVAFLIGGVDPVETDSPEADGNEQ